MSAESSQVGLNSIASSSTYNSATSSPPPESQSSPKRYPSNPGPIPKPIVYESGPCSRCNLSLQAGTEIVAYVGMGFAMLLIIIGVAVYAEEPKLVEEKIHDEPAKAKDIESWTNALEYGSVVNLVRGFYDLILYPMLWIGAVTRNRRICFVFLIAKLVLLCILLIGTGFLLLLFGHAYIPMVPIVLVIPEFYFLWVVLCFTEELKVVGVTGGQPRIKADGGPNDIYAADMFTTGIYGPGTPTGQNHAFPDYANRGHGENASEGDFTNASIVGVKSESVQSTGGWGGVGGICVIPQSSNSTPPPKEKGKAKK